MDGYCSSDEVLHAIARKAGCDTVDWARGEQCDCDHERGEQCDDDDCKHAAECYRLWQEPTRKEFRTIASDLLARYGADEGWEIDWGHNRWNAETLREEAGLNRGSKTRKGRNGKLTGG